jgi:hypothetical protein
MLFFVFVGDRVGKVHNATLQGTLPWFSFLTFVNDNDIISYPFFGRDRG